MLINNLLQLQIEFANQIRELFRVYIYLFETDGQFHKNKH